MMEKCVRCGRKHARLKLFGMSNRGKNPVRVCWTCHIYWYEHYIQALNSMHFSSDKWFAKWGEMYAEFLSLPTAKIKVEFT